MTFVRRRLLRLYLRLHRLGRTLNRRLGPLVAVLERRLLGTAPVLELVLPEPRRDFRVILPVANPLHAARLARFAAAVAAHWNGEVIVLYVTRGAAGRPGDMISLSDGAQSGPSRWQAVKTAMDAARSVGVPVGYVIREADNVGRGIRREARRQNADLIVMGWRGGPASEGEGEGKGEGKRLDATLDAVLEDPPSEVMVVGGLGDGVPHRLLVPFVPFQDTPIPLSIARCLARDGGYVTALRVVEADATMPEVEAAGRALAETLRRLGAEDVSHLVVRAGDRAQGILDAVGRGYDGVLMAAPKEMLLDRILFGDTQMTVARESDVPVIVVKVRSAPLTYVARRLWRRVYDALPKLDQAERQAVYDEIDAAAAPRADFFVMIGLSAAIASFGLLMDSPAVIIGAMLVAPLMAAIVGVGLGVVEGELQLIRRAASAALRGAVLAVAVSMVIGLLQPGGEAGPEIISRTMPTLLDLGVALASGAAGAYALSRKDVQTSLAGVAIAAALVPPLATVGIGVAIARPDIALGALLLYVTNFVAIAAAGGITFLLLGFGPTIEEEEERQVLLRGFQTAAVLLVLVVALLGALTWRLYAAAQLTREIEEAVRAELIQYPSTELVSVSRVEGDTLTLKVTIQLPSAAIAGFDYSVAQRIRQGVAEQLGRPAKLVDLNLTVIPTVHLEAHPPPDPTPTVAP